MALQIVYTHAGYMASVTGRAERADWSSERPMTADALIETLLEIGLHQQDIGDAFFEADPDWLTRDVTIAP